MPSVPGKLMSISIDGKVFPVAQDGEIRVDKTEQDAVRDAMHYYSVADAEHAEKRYEFATDGIKTISQLRSEGWSEVEINGLDEYKEPEKSYMTAVGVCTYSRLKESGWAEEQIAELEEHVPFTPEEAKKDVVNVRTDGGMFTTYSDNPFTANRMRRGASFRTLIMDEMDNFPTVKLDAWDELLLEYDTPTSCGIVHEYECRRDALDEYFSEKQTFDEFFAAARNLHAAWGAPIMWSSPGHGVGGTI